MLRRRDPLANPEPLIRRVYSYAAYRLGDGPDAEDATSESLERALRYRDSYDASAGAPQAWLLGIARRVVAEHELRRSRSALSLDGEVGELPEGDDAGSRSLERIVLRDGMRMLSPAERDLLALRFGADLTARDIAHVLGSRTNTVEVALHRTLARLRSVMDASEAAPAGAFDPLPALSGDEASGG